MIELPEKNSINEPMAFMTPLTRKFEYFWIDVATKFEIKFKMTPGQNLNNKFG